LRYYLADGPEKWAGSKYAPIVQTAGGQDAGKIPVIPNQVPQASRLHSPLASRLHSPQLGATTGVQIRDRGYLPHWTAQGAVYHVTFRLHDALPVREVEKIKMEREQIVRRTDQAQRELTEYEKKRLKKLYSDKIEKYLDGGKGKCYLSDAEVASVMASTLRHFDGDRYELYSWCIMPNHVHVVVQPLGENTLSEILHSWKSYTAHEANKILKRKSSFWSEEYYDHLIRDENEFYRTIEYIVENPAKAGLTDWPWVHPKSIAGVSPASSSTAGASPESAKSTAGVSPALCEFADGSSAVQGSYRLTTSERKRILLQHIYGVDIDTQAVEVTKLSLLLKVLEGQNQQSLDHQLKLFHERALPDLSANIKCGNSLIGPDFYQSQPQQLNLFDEDQIYRINAFDWTKEFPHIFKSQNPGFNAVIGNPPYVLLQDEFRDDSQLFYFRSNYEVASYKLDTYHLFVERCIQLSSKGGYYSMITPANFLTNNYLSSLRRYILNKTIIVHILIIDGGVFHGISVDNAIFVLNRSEEKEEEFPIIHVQPQNQELISLSKILISVPEALSQDNVLFTGSLNKELKVLWRKIENTSINLGSIANVNFGKQLRNRKIFKKDVIELSDLKLLKIPYKPCYTGRNVFRYRLCWGNLACFDNEVARCGGCWAPEIQNAEVKIVTRQIGKYPEYALDTLGYQCLNTMFMIVLKDDNFNPNFIIGVLNSKLLQKYWLDHYYDQRRTFPKIKGTYLKQLPIYSIDFSNPTDKSRHDQMVTLVERMLSLHQKLAAAQTPDEKNILQRQITTTDQQIDQLVYQLYHLTADEIIIIEEST